jgi:hypothetical protein
MACDRARGWTLLELVVCLLLVTGIGSATLRAYATLRVGVERSASVGSAGHAVRTVRSVLRDELGSGARGVDWFVLPPDSVLLRAFRAVAFPCGAASDSTLTVALRSGRVPDPEKDSVLILLDDATWVAADLASRVPSEDCAEARPAPAGSDPRVERWRLRPMPSGPATVLAVFESGSYHLSAGALRYRRGAGGRQPLTETVFAGAAFVDSAGRAHVMLESPLVPPARVSIPPGR